MNLILNVMELVIVLATCVIAELLKPLAFKVRFIKGAYPFIVLLLTVTMTIIYCLVTKGVLIEAVLKGIVLGAISCWCYDAIIKKLKNFIK